MAKLLQPYRQLRDKYTQQITRGAELLRREPRTGAELDALREEVGRWDNENRLLIQSTFSDGAAYNAYNAYAAAPIGADFRQAAQDLRRDVGFYKGQLESSSRDLDAHAPKPVALMVIVALVLVGLLIAAMGWSLHWNFSRLMGG